MSAVSRTSRAELDRVEIALRIAQHNPAAAERFIRTIDEKLRLLAQSPGIGQNRSGLAPNLRGFPFGNYVIFYRPMPDGIQLIRVLHGAREVLPHFFE